MRHTFSTEAILRSERLYKSKIAYALVFSSLET